MSVAVAVLAAGQGTRTGGSTPKALLELRGKPIIDWALESAMASDLHPVVIVVGYRARAVTRAAPSGVLIARTRRWRWGASYSLNAALELLEPWSQVDGVCIGLADQPLVGPDAYRRLAAAAAGGAALAVATYGRVRANPVLIARSMWGEARRLRGDVGARALMERHRVVEVDCTGTGDPTDVDTLDDLRGLEDRLS